MSNGGHAGGKQVSLEKQGMTGVITVDNPPVNSLSAETRRELFLAVKDAAENPDLRCLILRGGGKKFFMAGADIKSLQGLDAKAAYNRVRKAREFLDYLEAVPKPVIAAINGICLGGGLEAALCCDIRLSAEHAKLGFPEVRLGIMPGAGGTQRLPRLVGQGMARRMIFSGQPVTARQAASMGLVDGVAGAADLMDEALNLAESICKRGPLAVAAAKKAMNAAREIPMSQALDLENRLWAELFDSKDQGEGFKAFAEGRKPDFRGV